MAADTLPVGSGLVRVSGGGATFTVPVACQKLILPTNSQILLPMFNEYVLNSNRLTIAESPFGGLKGSGVADYAPGTVYINSGDGVYLTDINGNNSTKTLTSGKMKEVSSLTVDTNAKTITEEFILVNTNMDNTSTVLNNCDSSPVNSSFLYGTETGISLTTAEKSKGTGSYLISGKATAAGNLVVKFDCTSTNFSTQDFICFDLKPSNTTTKFRFTGRLADNSALSWIAIPGALTANVWNRVVLPIRPKGSMTSYVINAIEIGYFQDTALANLSLSFYVDNITLDIAKPATIEINTPDYLPDSSLQVYAHNGTGYNLCGTYKLDSNYSAVSTTSANWTFADSTKLDDVYPTSPNGRALYPKSRAGLAVTGSDSTQLTFSNNKGASKRIGFKVLLPPSDSGRTSLHKIRLKLVIYYDDVNKALSVLPDNSGSGNNGIMSLVGLTTDNVVNPYGAMKLDGVSSYINCGTASVFRITGSLSIELLLKTGADVTTEQHILTKSYESNISYRVFLSASTFSFYLSSDGNNVNRVFRKSTTIYPNTWYHIVAIFKPDTTADIYLNGVLANGALTGTIISSIYTISSSRLLLGCLGDTTTTQKLYFNGLISRAKLYNRVLSPDEATALYNNQSIDTSGLVGSWHPAPVQNMGVTTYEFEDSLNASYGLQNMATPWFVLVDSSGRVEYYIFTDRPAGLTFRRDDAGAVYEIVINPGNSQVFRGVSWLPDQTTDTDADLIPDSVKNLLMPALSGWAFNG